MPQTHAEYLTGRIEYYRAKVTETTTIKDKAFKDEHYHVFHDCNYHIAKYEQIINELLDALNHYNTSITPEQSPHESVCGC